MVIKYKGLIGGSESFKDRVGGTVVSREEGRPQALHVKHLPIKEE